MSNLQSTLSSSTTTIVQKNYDVFLNFRGEDTRDCFTCHLYDALHKQEIKTFIDDGLEKGDGIWQTLKGAIEISKISVVIFSKDYSSSKWCLRELVEIMKRQKFHNQTVIPVFYNVDPKNVRKQTGSFKDSFDKHGNESPEEVQKWREALTEASDRSGWDSSRTRPDTTLVDKIVKDIQKKLMGACTSVGVQEEAGKFTIPEQTCLWLPKGYQIFDSRMSILKDIIDALSDSDVNMVGIYGMGGVGKTTLAKEVAREAGPKNGLSLFDKIIFVEVSESPDIKNIQGVVAENLGLQFTEETVPGRANRLCDRLRKEKNILLILDNIWGKIDFERVGIPFENDRKELKLLLTTRDLDVLRNDSQHNFHIEALNEADALSLFKSIACTCTGQPNPESIALEVARECGGMPVAIVTIAKALKGHGQNKWRNALQELKNPSSKSFEGIAKGVYTSIKLSYDYLENKELKETFLLCSRMGQTYDASIQDLFRYGLGLGFFENFNTMEEALCKLYVVVDRLKDASLLLDVPMSEGIFDPPLASERFAMHDIICDVAKSIANVFTVIDVAIPQSWTNENTLINCTSITLYNIDELPEDLELVCPQLKLLYVKPKNSSLRIPDNFFTMMLRLQVLHLIKINLQPLPTSISCLLDLQALCLDRCELGDLAIIGNLKKLKIISFCGSDMEKLPEEMCHLTKLRLLDLTNCYNLSVIPPNVMSNLKKLEALYMGNTSIQWEVERPNIERSNVSIDELQHLRYLTMLEIQIPDAKMSKGLLSEKLEKYKIFIGDKWQAWHWSYRSKTCRMLKLSLNTNEDENILQYSKGIEELELGEVPGATNLFDALDRNGGFPKLKHLDVDSNSHSSCIVESCDALPLLESLHVRGMKVLEKICHRALGANSFLQLRTIRVDSCHNLNNIFSSSAVTILPQLEVIQVSSCENMEEILAIGGQDDANNTEVVHEIEFSQLRILRLEHLSRLKCFCCKMKTDSRLQLTSDTQPREIISEEEMDICTLLFNEKVAFPNLQTLDIFDIHVEKIWHNLPSNISYCVQNLTKLSISGCDNLKELFSSSTVVTEQSREEEMRDTILFPKLNRLEIKNLGKLTTLWSGYYIKFPTLKEFKIEECPQLDTFIFDDKVRVPSLEIMIIREMNNLKMIWHNQLDGDSIPKLKSLLVWRCQKLLTVFDLQGIISEERNSIAATQSRDLCFSNLQELKVYTCQSLKYLFAASNNVANDEYSPKFLFPKLTSLSLWTLPELRSFYTGRHTVEGPVLKMLDLGDCFIHDTDEEGQMQMQQPLFFVEQAFPCLEELTLGGKNIMVMWQDQVLESLLVKLKNLEVRNDDSTNLPLCIIQRFQNLEKLSLLFSSYKEIFSNGEDQTQAARPARIKTLHLRYLKDLEYMWKHDFKQLDLILQNLEVLNILDCNSLINVMPPSASFQNLTVMEVERCSSLINIGTSSAAKSLVQLTQMTIGRCKNIIEVVGNHGDVTEDEIIFPKLKSLSLEDLPSLTSFCSWNVTLQFPSLEELTVITCPQMKIFSQGVLTTQTLRKVAIDGKSIELNPDVDINKAIQQFHEKVNDSEDFDSEDYSDSSESLEM